MRARLATLALLGGLMFCSGCCPILRHWFCDCGRPRGGDCSCYDNPCATDVAQLDGPVIAGPVINGPLIATPGVPFGPSPLPLPTDITPMPPPGSTVVPPRVVPVPQASPMPYTPTRIFTPTRLFRQRETQVEISK